MIKTAGIYLVAAALSWFVVSLTWSAAGLVLGGAGVAGDEAVREEMREILQRHGVPVEDFPETTTERIRWVRELPPGAREDMQALIQREVLSRTNWFVPALIVSGVVFGVLGLLAGFFSREYVLVGVVPVLTFFIRNPLTYMEPARGLPWVRQLLIVAVGQFGAVYLFGWLGARLGRKRDRRRWERDKPSQR